jgi:predicted O-methyltransferase YrrM
VYSKWEQKLSAEAQINYVAARAEMRRGGSDTGVYPDVCYLLFRFANAPSIQSVLETGSGVSTYILAKTCLQLNTKEILTLESLEKWAELPRRLLEKYEIDPSFHYVTENRPLPVFSEGKQWDMMWVDGTANVTLDRVASCLYYRENLDHAIVLFDDAQLFQDSQIEEIVQGLGRSRSDLVWFNPTGRADRHVLISFPKPNHPLLSLVEECK